MLTKSLEGDVVQIVSGGVTDVGRVRTNNEDSFRIVEPLNLFILSDGMGGEAHGEVASSMAVETIEKYCSKTDESGDSGVTLHGSASESWSPQTKRLQNAVFQANHSIYQSAQNHPEQRGMGATVTAGWVNGSKLSIAHVGDSRAYLLRTGALQQLTNDHSLVAEQVRRGIITPQQAEESDMQSVLLRALGAHPDVDVDVDEIDLMPRDLLLFCSDGLTRMVTEPEIAGKLQSETDPAAAAQKLVDFANERGGLDNVTVIVALIQEESKGWFSWLRRDSGKKV
ncbi:MAG TPA: Stp1/IreP family PP2C-type Ser/Thr phosphatase [Candidatus Limnocylindrales bacterium]|nr:Stp1/IreP family PP2C-type Ser/Thr phosphatase [Candidatus Limnocylindrales bacterium]